MNILTPFRTIRNLLSKCKIWKGIVITNCAKDTKGITHIEGTKGTQYIEDT